MQYIARKATTKKFEDALTNPLVIVYTPKGFGKRTLISRYLNEHDKVSVWFHIVMESDEDWQWQLFQEKLKVALHLKESIPSFPIPETEEELSNVLYLYSREIRGNFYIVIDGITGTKPKFQKLVSLFANTNPYCFRLILICDSLHNDFVEEYEGRVSFLKTDDFRLTYNEIKEVCTKEKIEITREKIHSILSYSDGWIAAIELILLTLKRNCILTETKNINLLIEDAYYNALDDLVKKDLLYLSILNEFSLEQLYALCESKETIQQILQMERNQLFVHGSPSEGYTISGVLKDFLKIQLYKSQLDVQSIYQRIAKWFSENNDPIQAISMYLECNDFEGITQLLTLHYELSYMDIAPSLMVDVFRRMPMEYKYRYPYMYLAHILDTVTNIETHHGMHLLMEFKEDVEHGKYAGDADQLLGEYYFIHAFSNYNDAHAMFDDFDCAARAFKGGKSKFAYPFKVATFGSYHILYLYHRESGKMKELVDEVIERLPTMIHFTNGANGGGDYQVRAEYAFETGDYDHVLELSQAAYLDTLRYQQVSIEICSIFLKARYAILKQDSILLQEMVMELETTYQKCDNPILQSEIDCAQAYLHLLQGNVRDVSNWIKNEKLLYPQLLYESSMISFIILCFYQICTKRYEKVEYYCNILERAYGEQMHIFGLLYARIFISIGYYHLGREEEGIKRLHEACKLAQDDHLITIFRELAPHLKVLMTKFQATTPFEKEIVKMLRDETNTDQESPVFALLTKKEKEIMLKYAGNMTTRQIAEESMLSINTVQTHLKSIYAKLKINTKTELVHIVNREHNI
ncbi:helix-turn-helix transcriptional regulator [Amedibacillus sp. YH-ame10]